MTEPNDNQLAILIIGLKLLVWLMIIAVDNYDWMDNITIIVDYQYIGIMISKGETF